jgi:hypothetical protein
LANGELTTSKIIATGGTIGGWTISGNNLVDSGNTITLSPTGTTTFNVQNVFKVYNDGHIEFSIPDAGYLVTGKAGTEPLHHPYVSGLNVSTGGIALTNGPNLNTLGTQLGTIGGYLSKSIKIQSTNGGYVYLGDTCFDGNIYVGSSNYKGKTCVFYAYGYGVDSYSANNLGLYTITIKNGIIVDIKQGTL